MIQCAHKGLRQTKKVNTSFISYDFIILIPGDFPCSLQLQNVQGIQKHVSASRKTDVLNSHQALMSSTLVRSSFSAPERSINVGNCVCFFHAVSRLFREKKNTLSKCMIPHRKLHLRSLVQVAYDPLQCMSQLVLRDHCITPHVVVVACQLPTPMSLCYCSCSKISRNHNWTPQKNSREICSPKTPASRNWYVEIKAVGAWYTQTPRCLRHWPKCFSSFHGPVYSSSQCWNKRSACWRAEAAWRSDPCRWRYKECSPPSETWADCWDLGSAQLGNGWNEDSWPRKPWRLCDHFATTGSSPKAEHLSTHPSNQLLALA